MRRVHLYVTDDEAHLLEELRIRASREDRTTSRQAIRYIRDGLERDDEQDRKRRRRRR